MKRTHNKNRIPFIIAAVLLSAFLSCGFELVPDIAELKVTKPFIELDLTVKDSAGTNGDEEAEKTEAETEPESGDAFGTEVSSAAEEIKVIVRGDMIKLDNEMYSRDFEDFKKKFSDRYSRETKVSLTDDYADAKTFGDILAFLRKNDITPVIETK